MKSFCGWNVDPRDNDATWQIVWNIDLNTNVLCLTPAKSYQTATEISPDADDDTAGALNFDEPFMRAKLWSPKFRTAKAEVSPQCVQFAFKICQSVNESPFSLSLMSHSSR